MSTILKQMTIAYASDRFSTEDFEEFRDLSLNEDDFLHARMRTVGIWSDYFETNSFIYEVFDVDGRRSGRRKWRRLIDGMDCLLFVAPLAGYDRCLLEDPKVPPQNQLTESLLLFEFILSLTRFHHTSIVLILNKLDIFKGKIMTNTLKAYVPDYVGREKDSEAALTYIYAKFKAQQRLDDNRKLHIYTTDATNIRCCQAMLHDIEENLIGEVSVGQNIVNDMTLGVAI
ncbi:MAG: hypothetical protein Q9223_003241 [Gallowayella weberi]